MTTISATTVLASTSPGLSTIYTLQLRYPRAIHAEQLTHRMISTDPQTIYELAYDDGLMYDPNLSRNASSSRAIPVARLIADVERDPYVPIVWTKNEPGMQGREELKGSALIAAKDRWNRALESALDHARHLAEIGAHKQLVNRILEPYSHINVLVTATEWQNFLGLRLHSDAEPHIQLLAQEVSDRIQGVLRSTEPSQLLNPGQWHLPYVSPAEQLEITDYAVSREIDSNWLLRRVSTARSARLSYLTFDGQRSTFEKDNELCEKLLASRPFHASPFEHQATPARRYAMSFTDEVYFSQQDERRMRNFKGWIQNRALVEEALAA